MPHDDSRQRLLPATAPDGGPDPVRAQPRAEESPTVCDGTVEVVHVGELHRGSVATAGLMALPRLPITEYLPDLQVGAVAKCQQPAVDVGTDLGGAIDLDRLNSLGFAPPEFNPYARTSCFVSVRRHGFIGCELPK